MPRYRPESPLGYDLTLELPFIMIDGRKCKVGTAGSIILGCPVCGAQHFRQTIYPHPGQCFEGHGDMKPMALDDIEEWKKVAPAGTVFTTVEQRKAERLKEEAERPWNWIFGDLTEADFPEGFAEMNGIKAPAYQNRAKA